MNDYAVPTAARIADDLDLIGIYPDVADACTDKASMRKRWAADGLPQPAFRVAEVLEEAWDAAADIGYPVVLKPAVSTGGGSRGVSLVDGPTDLETAFEFAQSAYEDDRVLVEERANGTEHSVEVVVQKGDASALVVSDKVKTPAPYRVDKSVIYPTSLDDSMRERVERVAERATTAMGVEVGAAHVELAVTKAGLRLFEIGARCGGGATAEPVVRAVTGIDYFPRLCRLHSGEPISDWTLSRRDGVIYHFLTPSPGKISGVSGVEEVSGWNGVIDCRLWVSPGDKVSPVRRGGDRSGSVITHARSRSDAYKLAVRAEETIEFEYV
ncbi:UNVERIFIED_CONTAM: hypothetical protein BEN50_26005 [Euhalothece sp. KZN 001]